MSFCISRESRQIPDSSKRQYSTLLSRSENFYKNMIFLSSKPGTIQDYLHPSSLQFDKGRKWIFPCWHYAFFFSKYCQGKEMIQTITKRIQLFKYQGTHKILQSLFSLGTYTKAEECLQKDEKELYPGR